MQRPLPDLPLKISPVRLFFALWPDEETRRQLAHWRDVLRRQTGGRAMDTDDLHLTLAFIGDVAPDLQPSIIAATESVQARSFLLTIDRAEYWKHNRIVWAGCHTRPAALDEMVRELRNTLSKAGIRFDHKSFVPHITLLRDAPHDFELADLTPIEWQIDRFVLLRSSSGQRPRYRVAQEWRANSPR
ncbi:MAG TPA: RNA 2',3'-cyclic phosphodiesterase [Burkholderiales bacterium]|nr:RNA 2',3'-cyclic phosphodiesterase [Burkholderiales bacterium]